MKLFRLRRKPESGEEEKELVLDTDAGAQAHAQDRAETEGEAEAPADGFTPEVATDVPPQEEAPAPQADPLAQIGAEPDGETETEGKAPEAEGASPPGDDSLDPDLVDIFREAKNEVQESTLAAELEDIPIQDLLSDLVGISRRLGVAPGTHVQPAPSEADEPRAEPGPVQTSESPVGRIYVQAPEPPAEPEPLKTREADAQAAPVQGSQARAEPEPLGAPEPDAQPASSRASEPPAQRISAPGPEPPVEPGLRAQPAPSEADEPRAGPISAQAPEPPVEPDLRAQPAPSEEDEPRAEPGSAEAPEPPAEPGEGQDAAEPDPSQGTRAAGQPPTGHQRYTRHGLFLALVVAMVIGGGLWGAEQLAGSEHTQEPSIVIAAVPGAAATQEGHAGTAVLPAVEAIPQLTSQAMPEHLTDLQGAYSLYIIQPGDTVSSIAQAFGISPDYILWNNPDVIDEPGLLAVGEEILIPSVDAIIYHVKLGDTLPDIAAFYQIDVESIVAFGPNGLTSPDDDIEGMTLVLPGAVPPPPPQQAAIEAVEAATLDPEAAKPPPLSGGYIWPWEGNITRGYGQPRGGSAYHLAIDIDGFARYGAPVVAAASGRVVLVAYPNWGLGYHVVIQHDDGSRTVYGHLSNVYVKEGQHVAQGNLVGPLGCTGYCTDTFLHFELWIDGFPVDPLAYLP